MKEKRMNKIQLLSALTLAAPKILRVFQASKVFADLVDCFFENEKQSVTFVAAFGS